MRKVLGLVLPVGICLLVGFVASYFQRESLEEWYLLLNKSPLTPPGSVFAVAWTILYICMGLSIGLILNSYSLYKTYFVRLFGFQLLFNFSWSILFFYIQNPLLGAIDIFLLDLLVILYIVRSYTLFKASSLLFIPYFLWLMFATYLNLYILFHNPVF
ncbi:MAG: tryptophan-rich sensory protein [Tannerellaceae bacterium]|nr:tryptophan-rich sensory protein [Tannerellaceae bacterium]